MDYVLIGKIVNTHGVKGEVRLLSNFKFKSKVFKKGMIIYIGKDKIREVINTYRSHKQFDMITMEGYFNINDILKYKGLNVYIDKEDLNLQSDEYLDEELIGLNVVVAGKIKGVVEKIEDYKAYKLIVVSRGETYSLIPYVSDIIEGINFKEKTICIKDIKGLL